MYAHILQGNSGQETVWTSAMFFFGGGAGFSFSFFYSFHLFFPSVYILSFSYIYFWCGPYLKFLLNLLQYCFWFTFWFFGLEVCGMLALQSEVKPEPPALEGQVLTPGPPGKSRFFPSLLWQTQLMLTNTTERHSCLHTLRSAPWFYLRALFWSQRDTDYEYGRVNASGATLTSDEMLRVNTPPLPVCPPEPPRKTEPRGFWAPFQAALSPAVKTLPASAAAPVTPWASKWAYKDVQPPQEFTRKPHEAFGLLFKCLPTLPTGVHSFCSDQPTFFISLLLPKTELFASVLVSTHVTYFPLKVLQMPLL